MDDLAVCQDKRIKSPAATSRIRSKNDLLSVSENSLPSFSRLSLANLQPAVSSLSVVVFYLSVLRPVDPCVINGTQIALHTNENAAKFLLNYK